MPQEAFRRNNHYLPEMYLSQWSNDGYRISAYRLLVSHQNVPLWTRPSIEYTASHDYLYAQTAFGPWDDSLEKWLCDEFEAPAKEALNKALLNAPLTSSDWQRLICFLAAQDVRTPAQLIEGQRRWEKQLPELMESVLKDVVRHLENGTLTKAVSTAGQPPLEEAFPMRVIKKITEGSDDAHIGIETLAGRSLWLYSIRHLLKTTVNALLKNKWTILRAPPGLQWITSDAPVVKLNYNNLKQYDLKGGWGNKGSEIFMPLSPSHLMYTQVGHRPPERYSVVNLWMANMLQRFSAENAYRHIFSVEPNRAIEKLRPRIVNLDAYQNEERQWKKWHESNVQAEQSLFTGAPNSVKPI